ncbi:TPA: hypothetical protein QDC22_000514 [Burkholderia stabilis]|uniref:hypothetical protein n=1 Tax=Burkholderia stabilis TaxID=95485 RepID=UPI00158FBC64|nr:hypothetical protein [Burkholderia stabilis]HDR9581954.1 hypothetical protein [Burkholderia stabilis]HDR9646706.1 hypothetical protein [Burkholderia stabilis]HDR9677790.1 hypothetical protein [Burkholderia stabilis]
MTKKHATFPYFLHLSMPRYATVQQRHTSQIFSPDAIDQYAIQAPNSADWVFTNFD